jgi:hypothetical protein
VLYASLNTILSLETATDSSGLKVRNLFSKNHHPWHHSLDKKLYTIRGKFEVRCVISFSRKYMPSKKWHFSWGAIHPFFTGGDWTIRHLFGFLNWEGAKSEIRLFIHLRQSEFLGVHKIQAKPEQQQRNLRSFAQDWP